MACNRDLHEARGQAIRGARSSSTATRDQRTHNVTSSPSGIKVDAPGTADLLLTQRHTTTSSDRSAAGDLVVRQHRLPSLWSRPRRNSAVGATCFASSAILAPCHVQDDPRLAGVFTEPMADRLTGVITASRLVRLALAGADRPAVPADRSA
jgi:hypothetical protein